MMEHMGSSQEEKWLMLMQLLNDFILNVHIEHVPPGLKKLK